MLSKINSIVLRTFPKAFPFLFDLSFISRLSCSSLIFTMAHHSTSYTNPTIATSPLVDCDASPRFIDLHNNPRFLPNSHHEFLSGDYSGANLGFNLSPPTGPQNPQIQSIDPLSWTINPTEYLHIPPSPHVPSTREEQRQEYTHTR